MPEGTVLSYSKIDGAAKIPVKLPCGLLSLLLNSSLIRLTLLGKFELQHLRLFIDFLLGTLNY